MINFVMSRAKDFFSDGETGRLTVADTGLQADDGDRMRGQNSDNGLNGALDNIRQGEGERQRIDLGESGRGGAGDR